MSRSLYMDFGQRNRSREAVGVREYAGVLSKNLDSKIPGGVQRSVRIAPRRHREPQATDPKRYSEYL
jgi:hypothetical protein